MPQRSQCPKCAKRVPGGVRRCIGCGASVEAAGSSLPGRRAILLGLVLATLLGFVAWGQSDRYAPVVSDWYADMVIRYVPDGATRFLPAADDERAFYACARRVVQQIQEESSIATFVRDVRTEALEEGRYRIESWFDESLESGRTERHRFTCTVRLEGGSWILEDLEMMTIGPASPDRHASR